MKNVFILSILLFSLNIKAQTISSWENFTVTHPNHWNTEKCFSPMLKLVTYFENEGKKDWLLMNIKVVNIKYMNHPTIDTLLNVILARIGNDYIIVKNERIAPNIHFIEMYDKSQKLTEMIKIFEYQGKFYQSLFYYEDKTPKNFVEEGRVIFNTIKIK